MKCDVYICIHKLQSSLYNKIMYQSEWVFLFFKNEYPKLFFGTVTTLHNDNFSCT